MLFKIPGQIRGGKNNMITTRSGLHFPRREWAIWRNETVNRLLFQKKSPIIEVETRAHIHYTPADNRRRDVPAVIDAIWHCLERAGIVKDDSLIKDVLFHGFKKSPSAGVELTLVPKPEFHSNHMHCACAGDRCCCCGHEKGEI